MKKLIILTIFSVSLSMVTLDAVYPQQSVRVPDDIQEQVQEFHLSIDRLNALQANIESDTEQFLKALKTIRKEINKYPKGSKKRRLEVNRYRSVLSESLANTYDMLYEMQTVRDGAVSQLQYILSQIGEKESPALKELGNKLIKTEQGLESLRKKQVNLAVIIKYGLQSDSDEKRLRTELELIREYEMPTQQHLSDQLHRLQPVFAQGPGVSFSVYKNHLSNILTQLRHGTGWIDAQMIYIETLAALDNERVKFEEAISSIIGLVEKFKDYVNVVNESIDIRRLMDAEIKVSAYKIWQEEIPIPAEIPRIESMHETSLPKSSNGSSESTIDDILKGAKTKYSKKGGKR